MPDLVFDADFLRSLSALSLAVARLRAREGGGSRRADRRGGRTEFADRRVYVHGDDVRDVDWQVHARTGRLYVKEYERREDAEAFLVVDASASMGFHGKLATACRLAWALAWAGLGGGGAGADARARVALARGGGLDVSPVVRTRAGLGPATALLRGARAEGRTDLSASLAKLPPASRGTRVLVLLSDLLAGDDGRRALAALAARGETASVVHLVARADHRLPAEGAFLVDAETGERIPADGDAERRAAERLAATERTWRGFAARHRIRYLRADAAARAEDLVLGVLRGGGLLQ